jgi:hypothetical protein
MHRQSNLRTFVQFAHHVHFALAGGTWTSAAEGLKRYELFLAIIPLDGQLLTDLLQIHRSHT